MTSGATARVRIEEPEAAPSAPLDLSARAWKEAFPGLRVRDLADGAPVYRRGDDVDAVFVVESGYVRFCAAGPHGRERTSSLLSARQSFGPGLDGGARAADSAYAQGPVRVYRVPGAEFRRALALGSPFAHRALQIVRARDRMLARRMGDLARLPAPQRVLATLAELLVHHGAPCDHGAAIHVRLGARELADLAGALDPQVRMTLGTLRRRGFVRGARDHVCVSKLTVLLRFLRRQGRSRPTRPAG